MLNAIWESFLHSIEEWNEALSKGKVILENKRTGIEGCLIEMVFGI